jgi:hypothetical protein
LYKENFMKTFILASMLIGSQAVYATTSANQIVTVAAAYCMDGTTPSQGYHRVNYDLAVAYCADHGGFGRWKKVTGPAIMFWPLVNTDVEVGIDPNVGPGSGPSSGEASYQPGSN